MTVTLPRRDSGKLLQYNRSEILGDIDISFNLDLASSESAVRTNRMIKNFDIDDESGLERVPAFEVFGGNIYAITDDKVWRGNSFPSEAFVDDTAGITINKVTADMAEFNDFLYVSSTATVSGNLEINKRTTAGVWSNPITIASASGTTILEEFGDSLYLVLNSVEVRAISKADVVSTTVGTLDLGLPTNFPDGFNITMLKASVDRLWIGLTGQSGNKGVVYTWDGETQNKHTNRYELDYGVVCGVVQDNIPYVLDAIGRLLVFTGAAFKEVARLPIGKYPLANNSQPLNTRWVHPNGMAIDEDEILVNISNEINGTGDKPLKLAAGIWAYSKDTGFYHKYSATNSDGTVNDYGQMNGGRPGAIKRIIHNGKDDTDEGTIIAGMLVWKDSLETSDKYGIYYNNSFDNIEKWGFFTTKKLMSDKVSDTWTKLYAIYKNLINSADRIIIKYKTRDDIPTDFSLTWTSTTGFTSTDDLSDYEVGDEVQVLQAVGAGKSAHIESISKSGGTYTVALDETFTGATGTARARLEKWLKGGTITVSDDQGWRSVTLPTDNKGPWVKLKVCMNWTGENELYKTRIINSNDVDE